jgi:SNF2 family DNA or RNA helicase
MFRILILCPKIVVDNWENEFNYWLKDVHKIFVIHKFSSGKLYYYISNLNIIYLNILKTEHLI